jgi:hypothetical protein
VDVFKDACQISEINSKHANFFAEKMKKLRQDMYHIYLADKLDKHLKGASVVVSFCIETDTSRVSKLNESY